MSTGVVVTHAYRSAVGRSGRGTLRHTRPDELLAQLITGLMERAPEVAPSAIDDVVIGCAFPEAEQLIGPGLSQRASRSPPDGGPVGVGYDDSSAHSSAPLPASSATACPCSACG